MSIDVSLWKREIARIGDTAEPKTYLGDLQRFETDGLPDFLARPDREFAILPVVEIGASADEVIGGNRRVIEAVAKAGVGPFQLVVEWKDADVTLEPAVVAVAAPGIAAGAFEARLAEVRRALGGKPDRWLFRDADGLWLVSEGSRVALPYSAILKAISAAYRGLYEGRSGDCWPLGLTVPQCSTSALYFQRIGLGY